MPLGRRAKFKVELKLPLISIGVDDVGALFKRDKDAGPFMIMSRACGMALDTAFQVSHGGAPIVFPGHGQRHQLWYLRPSGHPQEILIVSAESGLALDAQ